MKVAERVLERRLRQTVEIDKMQFGFRTGTGTTDAIFIARLTREVAGVLILVKVIGRQEGHLVQNCSLLQQSPN